MVAQHGQRDLPAFMPGSTSLGPNRSSATGRTSDDSRPTSNLLSPAGCNAQASRSSRTSGSSAGNAASGTSTSTRRRRAGGPPACGRIAVSSRAISAGGTPSTLRKKVWRRVRTSNIVTRVFVPATARTRWPTGPAAHSSASRSADLKRSFSSIRLRAPEPSTDAESRPFSDASASRRRPERRMRSAYPARWKRKSSVSK